MPHLPDYAICVIWPSRRAAADRQQTKREPAQTPPAPRKLSLDLGYAALPA